MENKNSRRDFIKKSAVITLAGAGLKLYSNTLTAGMFPELETFATLPDLPYAYNALEPYIDSMTMEIHHGKHHKAYLDNLNKAFSETNEMNVSLENMLRNISKYSVTIRNNAGGHFNHSFFWNVMDPKGGGAPSGPIAEMINANFGSFIAFREKFNAAATGRFGSGWAWLIQQDDKLAIASTPNQDNPLMDVAEVHGRPLLALDVWEHAYYLKYQNKRADYVNAWWNVVNWSFVNKTLTLRK
jgi:superoxide dismutase, Fe-Mn family